MLFESDPEQDFVRLIWAVGGEMLTLTDGRRRSLREQDDVTCLEGVAEGEDLDSSGGTLRIEGCAVQRVVIDQERALRRRSRIIFSEYTADDCAVEAGGRRSRGLAD